MDLKPWEQPVLPSFANASERSAIAQPGGSRCTICRCPPNCPLGMILTTLTQRCAMGLLLPLRGTPQLRRPCPPPLFPPPSHRSHPPPRLPPPPTSRQPPS